MVQFIEVVILYSLAIVVASKMIKPENLNVNKSTKKNDNK